MVQRQYTVGLEQYNFIKQNASFDDEGMYQCFRDHMSDNFEIFVGEEPTVFFDIQSDFLSLYEDSLPVNLSVLRNKRVEMSKIQAMAHNW